MKIGIYFTANHNNGGVYQYSLAFLEVLARIKGHEYVIITTSRDIPKTYFQDPRFTVINLSTKSQTNFEAKRTELANQFSFVVSFVMSLIYRLRLFVLIELIAAHVQRDVLKTISNLNLDLLVFPAGSDLSYLVKMPTIVAIHDLQHRLNPQFPEVSAGGRFQYREHYYHKIAKNSLRILVDSEVGKEDVLACYPEIDPNKIIVLPFLPNPFLNLKISKSQVSTTLKKLHLKTPYIFYPAQLWPHKNHLVLVKALQLLHAAGKKVSLVLTGSKNVDFSTYDAIIATAKSYNLSSSVRFLGYVTSEELCALYKGALALTMPTYFGPTNIPVLEAWALGVPVIYSDIRGCREQLGDGGLLAQVDDPEAWARAITKLLTSISLAPKLITKGKKRLAKWQPSDFSRVVSKMIQSL